MLKRLALAIVLLSSPLEVRAASPLPIGARSGMVVSAQRLASDAGVAVLRRGGNAVDAAVTVAYALAVTHPVAGNIGGGGFMTIRLANGRTTFIDFRETAPAAASATMYQDRSGHVIPGLSTRGHLSAGVPGTVAGLELARMRYGTRTRAELMAPAIAFARDGFALDQGDIELFADATGDFRHDAASAAVFLNHGQPWRVGDRLVQPDLARTLAAIAAGGPAAFYQGPVAYRIAAASAAHHGILTTADLARYRAIERTPVTCDYRGYHLISAPPPSSGGAVICETLEILSGYPMAKLGFHSSQEIHYLAEALRRAFHDRNLQLGDPAFVKTNIERLISPVYAASLRADIAPDRATPSASLPAPGNGHDGPNTTHFSIVDRQGNAVSLTYTLNDSFGARVTVPGTGILLNDEMDDFTAKPGEPNLYGLIEGPNNAIAPGKRPLSSMTPTIVTRGDKLVAVLGTPGGSHIPTAVLQVLLNLIDHGMTLTEAVDAPRIHEQWLPDVIYYEKDALSADTIASLEARGNALELIPYWNQVAAILVGGPALGSPPRGGDRLYGALDPRGPTGSVAGY